MSHSTEPQVTVYTTPICAYCRKAKAYLTQRSIRFDEIDFSTDDETRSRISQEHNWRTVPMIFVEDKFIGGCDELIAMGEEGKLDHLAE